MASSPKLISFLFLLTLLFLQIHARESHFFSKIPNNNNNNNFDTQIPEKLDEPLTNPEKTTTPQDQQPNFIPQTQDNGYGLYGHESGQFPPSDDNNNNINNNNNNDVIPYGSQSEGYYNNNNDNNFHNGNSKKQYDNSLYYNNNNNKNLYDNGRQSFQNTRLSRDDYTTTTTTTTTPSYDQEQYNNFNNNNNNNGGRNDANNVVRQGMSDTRFMENGKYFYDLDMEPHHYRRTRGNFGNNDNYNNNNGNTYEYGSSMGRFQNDDIDDAESQEEPDEFVP